MEKESASGTQSLENELRSMILSNVTIAPDQSNHDSSTHGPQYRRGRGGYYRGRNSNRSFQRRSDRGDTSAINAPGSPASRGKDGPRPQRENYHQSQPKTHTYNQFPPHNGLQAGSNVANDQHTPSQPRHISEHRQRGRAGYLNAVTPGHKILQSPHDNSTSPGRIPSSPMAQQGTYMQQQQMDSPIAQVEYLDRLAAQEIPKVEITLPELEEKEAFRKRLESICQKAFSEGYSGDIASISLVGFGSLASGFGMPGSDMDLAIVPTWKDPSQTDKIGIGREIPRILERAVLDSKMGGRLLTRTRVPILKVCQHPTDTLYIALSEERQKWDELPEEEKYPAQIPQPEPSPLPKPSNESEAQKSPAATSQTEKPVSEEEAHKRATNQDPSPSKQDGGDSGTPKEQAVRAEKPWLREKALGPLDFPKDGVGIQCDINFENPLGLHNTHLLRCYSLTDPRVRPLVLFVKSWAKRRKINSSYSGTLSSYGWVLMMLHYLVNIAQPPVCPNLQLSWRPKTDLTGLEDMFKDTVVSGYCVRFWRDENEILHAAHSGQLSRNRQTIGALLRGFFRYYASLYTGYTYGQRPPSFYWTAEVLSLRTPGGIRTKQEKGWVSAKTTYTAEKKVTNRYLFAIEDPFEIDHNVARTVTHRGIVAIRDEFRRAWRILAAIGRNQAPEGGLFDQVVEIIPPVTPNTPNTPREAEQKAATEKEEAVVDVRNMEDPKAQGAVEASLPESKILDVAAQGTKAE